MRDLFLLITTFYKVQFVFVDVNIYNTDKSRFIIAVDIKYLYDGF